MVPSLRILEMVFEDGVVVGLDVERSRMTWGNVCLMSDVTME